MHRCFDAKKLLSSDEAGDSSFNFGRNIEFKKMIISMQKKKHGHYAPCFFCLVSHGRSETKWKGLDKYKNRRLIFYQLCILYYMIKELV